MLLLICNRELLFIGKRKDEYDVAKSTKTYEERIDVYKRQHVVHNNTATFYSRNKAFSMMGFDTFTSKELMNITQYTPNGNWPTDDLSLIHI